MIVYFSQMMDWFGNSLLRKLDIMAGYEIDFPPKISPILQFEMAFSDIWISLTPNGGVCCCCFFVVVF